jgi:hypothetical protein
VLSACIEGRVFAPDIAALLRRVRDLVLQMAGLMIAAELAQRRLVELMQNLAQLLGFGIAGCETLSVNLTQCADQGVSVLVAYFAILVAVTIVETWFAHAALHHARAAAASSCLDEMATKAGSSPHAGEFYLGGCKSP